MYNLAVNINKMLAFLVHSKIEACYNFLKNQIL